MWGGGCVFLGGEIVILNEVKNLLSGNTLSTLSMVDCEEIATSLSALAMTEYSIALAITRTAPDTAQYKRLTLSLFGLFGQPHLYTQYASSKSILLITHY